MLKVTRQGLGPVKILGTVMLTCFDHDEKKTRLQYVGTYTTLDEEIEVSRFFLNSNSKIIS